MYSFVIGLNWTGVKEISTGSGRIGKKQGRSCTWLMLSRSEREGWARRKGVVQWPGAAWLLAHMSKPKGKAACLGSHLGPIRDTSHRGTREHERDTHTHTTHTVVEGKCPIVSGGKGRVAVSPVSLQVMPLGFYTPEFFCFCERFTEW